MSHVLIVEDERPISDLIRMSLGSAGYRCACAFDGLDALRQIEEGQFDLVLLDVMLPGIDGFGLMDYIRPLGIPVIFITAKDSVADRVKGLRIGADDYLVKPFDVLELLARVEAVLRRYGLAQSRLALGGVAIDTDSRTALRDGQPVQLTKKEYDLLLLFTRNRHIALFRDQIYEKVWESDYLGDSRTVDLHVQRLRKKLGWEAYIVSVYKVGYRLDAPDDPEQGATVGRGAGAGAAGGGAPAAPVAPTAPRRRTGRG
ncbi:MAG: response regulator transcription factor [Coriobacteriales bacterium]|nr:response regulator transcription factor [Coriobacteriales bacterium]